VLILALDTCDARGCVALLRGDVVLASGCHESSEDYSAWLLPAVAQTLASAGVQLADVDLFAAAAGPGSFTGLRVGLTSVKAWSELYHRPVVGVSRLEALANQADSTSQFIASFVDARRAQIFAALYRRSADGLQLVGEEAVIAAAQFLAFVEQQAVDEPVTWVSLDPECITREPSWAARAARGESILQAEAILAPAIARIATRRAATGELSDSLTLDANYVRRSDAEIFWKDAAHGR